MSIPLKEHNSHKKNIVQIQLELKHFKGAVTVHDVFLYRHSACNGLVYTPWFDLNEGAFTSIMRFPIIRNALVRLVRTDVISATHSDVIIHRFDIHRTPFNTT